MKNVFVDFKKVTGKIKPIHGVNNGVLGHGFWVDTSAYFKELRIPYSRFHDTEYPFGSGHLVDVNCIFKDFDADPDDPLSYDFRLTDIYIKAIKDCGTDIIYRLGTSIENAGEAGIVPNLYINPPKDYLKWAQICEHIIKHYNEGWADGFRFDIKYWAIWGEPDSMALWTGTREEFYEFYNISAKHLRKTCPDIKIGGYGSIGFYEYTKIDAEGFNKEPYISLIDYIRGFLLGAKKAGAPVDFFDFHLYSDDVEEFKIHPKIAKKTLAECGFPDAEIILDEWNVGACPDIATQKTAAMAAAAMITMQNSEIDIATYYDAGIKMKYYNGLFTYELGKLLKRPTFYAFKTFSEIYSMENQVESECEQGLYALAASDGKRSGIMVSNHKGAEGMVNLNVSGCGDDYTCANIYISDETRKFELVRKDGFTCDEFNIYVKLKENSILYVELTQKGK